MYLYFIIAALFSLLVLTLWEGWHSEQEARHWKKRYEELREELKNH